VGGWPDPPGANLAYYSTGLGGAHGFGVVLQLSPVVVLHVARFVLQLDFDQIRQCFWGPPIWNAFAADLEAICRRSGGGLPPILLAYKGMTWKGLYWWCAFAADLEAVCRRSGGGLPPILNAFAADLFPYIIKK